MTSRLRIIVAVALLVCAASAAVAQAPPPLPPPPPRPVGAAPARDTTPEPTGTGRIRGRVVDAENGTALRDTMLRLTGGGLRQTRVGTDDEGRFEFENLPGGRYTLTANKPGYMTLMYGQRRAFETGRPIELADNQTLEGIDFAVPRGGVIVARVTDENGEPISDIRVEVQRYRFAGGQRALAPISTGIYQGTDDRGEVRVYGLAPGDYYVAAMPSSVYFFLNATGTAVATSGTADAGRSYVPTFFPGTPSVDDAERVTVAIGREVSVSIQLTAVKFARVSGTVRRADGSTPVRTSVSLLFKTPESPLGPAPRATVQPDGTFTISSVPPGEYTLEAMSGDPGSGSELGRVPVSVSGADVTGVAVTTARGGTVRGRLRFEPETPPTVRLGTVRPYLTGGTVRPLGAPNTQDDGTFTINGLFEQSFIRVLTPPPGWYLKAVRIEGRDVTDVPVSVSSGGELHGVEIVLTQQRAEITGSVADAKGAAVGDYTVVAFPEDRSQWTAASRFIASARPDQQGRFKLSGLPPGKYLAAAVDYLETGSERDPELLERLRERATAVTVGEGETTAVTLSLQ